MYFAKIGHYLLSSESVKGGGGGVDQTTFLVL